jgi:anti-anti-sigma factor
MPESVSLGPPRARSDRGRVTRVAAARRYGPALPARTEHGRVVAVLSGPLDVTSTPTVREQFLRLLGPASSRLVLDLSGVSHIDASGLAVLVGTERRARLLGGSLALAAAGPAVSMALRAVGLDRLLDTCPTVQSAVSGPACA